MVSQIGPTEYDDPFGDEVRGPGENPDADAEVRMELDAWFDQQLAAWESERDEDDADRMLDAASTYADGPW